MKTITGFCLFALCQAMVALNLPGEFGRISRDELEMVRYSEDETANALVLYDIGKTHFQRTDKSFELIFERSTRIKIFNSGGLEWAEVEIPFYREGNIYEQIYDLEAFTYNLEDGHLNRIRLDVSLCYDEIINEYWTQRKFAMPDVREGSVIEFRYKIRSQYMFNLRPWRFQWQIPVYHSEYEVRMIPFYEYTWLYLGPGFYSQTSFPAGGLKKRFGSIEYEDMVHRYVMKKVPAFYDEEFIASISDHIFKIDFQLSKINYPGGASVDILTTWENLVRDLDRHGSFGKYVGRSEKASRRILNSHGIQEKSQDEKFDFIINYVKENFRWNQRRTYYASKSANNFISEKHGNSADINLFAVGMLRAAGIEARPVLISTRDHGKIACEYPYKHFFNYVLIYANVDGKGILSDATEMLVPNDRIPVRCINDRGLVINRGEVNWLSLKFPYPSEIITEFSIEFDETDITAEIITSATEYDGLSFRLKYGDDEDRLRESLLNKNYVIDSSFSLESFREISEPYNFRFKTTNTVERIDQRVYIKPFFNETLATSPLIFPTRSHPVDMTYPVKRTYRSVIRVPDGYAMEFQPANYRINNNRFFLEYEVTRDGDVVNILFSYWFKLPEYPADDYRSLRFYFDEIIRKGNEKLVLTAL
jgi:hypothetical protein